MKIALINENSQAAKNAQIYEVLNEEAQKAGHTVFNYGMYSAEDDVQLTYVKNGLLASILLTTKAVDFVVTGCGTGQGAMLACNSFPNVLCGHITDAVDAYLFGQVNDGNCIAMPFAQGSCRLSRNRRGSTRLLRRPTPNRYGCASDRCAR